MPDTPCPAGFIYRIRAGDTFYALAQRYGIPVGAIIAANPGVDPENLQIGKEICIPAGPAPGPCPGGNIYTIKQGDTFFRLAQRFGISVEDLIAANPGVDPDRLRIGQQICIPVPQVPPVPGACVTVLSPAERGLQYSSGIVWYVPDEGRGRFIVIGTNLPEAFIFREAYRAVLSTGASILTVSMEPIQALADIWIGVTIPPADFPVPSFLSGGSVIILPGPVLRGTVNCG